MDASHALFQPVGVPGDVIVEQDVAALEVDPFAGRLGGHQHLDRAVPELLLGIQPGARLIAAARLHAAVDEADPELPLLQTPHQVIQRVFELGEDQEALLRVLRRSPVPGAGS